jgi:nicotinate phosphoribosyltransferase
MTNLNDIHQKARNRFPFSLALLTDLYQLTMAYGFWKTGIKDKEAVYHLFFRKNPFQGGFTVASGLEDVVFFLLCFRFAQEDLKYLAELTGNDGNPLFEESFLKYLEDLRFSGDIDAVPEGTVVFPHEPLLRIQGPIIECQILETPLLNLINFQSLVATKAARICQASRGEPVLEFGLRRAQGIDGGLSASRAAYIGGCSATSNVLAGKMFGIPVRGTHAHSWIMAFPDEMESFRAYAKALPNNCIFLVDTYDSLEGVKKAVEMGKWLRQQGHELMGIRLDSGDLAYLSVEARKILDANGFEAAVIVGSNDLDENIITSIKDQGGAINVWGVGTRLATAFDEPALGGVYKLTALRSQGNPWEYKIKLSEQAVKITAPGRQQVRRFSRAGEFVGDAIYDLNLGISEECLIVDPLDVTRRKKMGKENSREDLLQPVFRKGLLNCQLPALTQIRAHLEKQLSGFHTGVKRFVNPHQYPVGLEQGFHDLKTNLVLQARGLAGVDKEEKKESS